MTATNSMSRTDAMAVGANHIALRNFFFRLGHAVRGADIQLFGPTNMVKIQRDGVFFVPTIRTAMLGLVSIKPVSNAARPSVSLRVNSLSVSGFGKALFPPFSVLIGRRRRAWLTASFAARRRAIFRRPLCVKAASAMLASALDRINIFPRWHNQMFARNVTPCKPDIFAKTYEAV